MDSYNEILTRMQERFTALAGYAPDDASDIGIRMKVLAGEIYSVSSAIDWLKMQTFAQSAQGDQLDLRAQERGLARKQSFAASGQLAFQRSTPLWYDALVPAGTVCATAGDSPVRYVTTEAAILKSGGLSITVPAKAEQGGKSGNTQPGTVTVMVTPPSAIESVTNPAAFSGGEDSESDSELRARLMRSYASISNGTNAAFYREAALKYNGVYSVGVVPRENGAGTVSLYLGGRGAAPSAEVIGGVQSGLNLLREINVDVKVAAAQTVPVNIDVAVTPADAVAESDAQAACEQAVREYFNDLSVGESVIVTALGVKIFGTGKIKNYIFNTSVTADKKISAGQLAVCGTVKVGYYAGVSL
ncbi:baseplate J/gp47 family protein [Caproiciproducens sp.]|uniref:baseplate J/gp47 family protein n=1 Tax=Caproiciproducens sp. TaxID=1954376 RepID=UPI00289CB133|nr:baseplate J/gp47 family protein [Caproiciproducens sp.]